MADQTPMDAVLELQRRTLEQTQRTIEQHLAFQHRLTEAVSSGLAEGAEARERSSAVTRTAMHRYLDILEDAVPGAAGNVEAVREAVDEQFDAMDEAGASAFEMTEERVADYGELSAATLEQLADHLDLLAETHADVRAETEAFLDRTDAQLEELRDDAAADVEEQIERIQERTRELREQVRRGPGED
jgi:short-subunit dehydrogenase involved in D-alanine esterification of teichoic acids